MFSSREGEFFSCSIPEKKRSQIQKEVPLLSYRSASISLSTADLSVTKECTCVSSKRGGQKETGEGGEEGGGAAEAAEAEHPCRVQLPALPQEHQSSEPVPRGLQVGLGEPLERRERREDRREGSLAAPSVVVVSSPSLGHPRPRNGKDRLVLRRHGGMLSLLCLWLFRSTSL